MASITNEQINLIYINLIYKICFVMFVTLFGVKILIEMLPSPSGNFTETAYTYLATEAKFITDILSSASFLISFIAMALTHNSLVITEKTLILTETEQKIRDIENSLALFYFPLRDYINDDTNERVAINKNPNQEEFQSEILQIELNKINEHLKEMCKTIAPYRYLAEAGKDTDTRALFESFRKHNYIFQNPYEKSKLLDSVVNDITSKENKRMELKKTLNM